MAPDIRKYHKALKGETKNICDVLAKEIAGVLTKAESKVWHGHPVWFLEGNPIVGYAPRKKGVTLLFWSGQSFTTPGLKKEGSFKAAQAVYVTAVDVKATLLRKWLRESKKVQWNYKDIVKNKGKLSRLP